MSCLPWFCLFAYSFSSSLWEGSCLVYVVFLCNDPSYKELKTLYVNKQKQRKQDMIPLTKNWRHYT
jgi:hypothetical protein